MHGREVYPCGFGDIRSWSWRVRRAFKTTRWVHVSGKWIVWCVWTMYVKREHKSTSDPWLRPPSRCTRALSSGEHARCVLALQHVSHDKISYVHTCAKCGIWYWNVANVHAVYCSERFPVIRESVLRNMTTLTNEQSKKEWIYWQDCWETNDEYRAHSSLKRTSAEWAFCNIFTGKKNICTTRTLTSTKEWSICNFAAPVVYTDGT